MEVPVQIKGMYPKVLFDSDSQITILYRSFYDAYLKHLPIQPLENLEICIYGSCCGHASGGGHFSPCMS